LKNLFSNRAPNIRLNFLNRPLIAARFSQRFTIFFSIYLILRIIQKFIKRLSQFFGGYLPIRRQPQRGCRPRTA
jgi:hypothetical protein